MNCMLTVSIDDLANRARELENSESDYARFGAPRHHWPADTNAALPLLRPGAWDMDFGQLRPVVLEEFPRSASRPHLWQGLVNFFTRLREFRVAKELWIGGSFLTSKQDPDTIDIAVVLHAGQFAEKAESGMRDAIEELFDQRVLLQRYGLDVGYLFNGDFVWTAYARGAFGFESNGTTARGFAVVWVPE